VLERALATMNLCSSLTNLHRFEDSVTSVAVHPHGQLVAVALGAALLVAMCECLLLCGLVSHLLAALLRSRWRAHAAFKGNSGISPRLQRGQLYFANSPARSANVAHWTDWMVLVKEWCASDLQNFVLECWNLVQMAAS
jgi:hypothetical protein